jgi:hypothetical protein
VAKLSKSTPQVAQSRLILQDATAGLDAPAPVLRMSWEIGPVEEVNPVREQARETWRALQATPQQVATQTAQLREADARAVAATNQVASLQAQTTALQAEFQELKDTRWQHPGVAIGVALLLGFGVLWLLERRKRLVMQRQLHHYHNEQNSDWGSAQDVAEPLPKFHASNVPLPHVADVLPRSSAPAPMWRSMNDQEWVDAVVDHSHHTPSKLAAQHSAGYAVSTEAAASTLVMPSLQEFAAEHMPEAPLLRQAVAAQAPLVEPVPRQPWWKLLRPRKAPEVRLHDSHPSAVSGYPSTQLPETQIDPYEDDGFGLDTPDSQINPLDYYDPDLANIEMLSQTRLQPSSNDDAIAHLLELRMAVQALCALEQAQAALNLLLQHVDAVPTTCAWAYMEYLDLSAKLGQREGFESMRKRYRLQFNRLAPYWMEPNGFVQNLDKYDRPLAELSAVWQSPEQSRALIHNWLLGNLHSRRLFQLPAYHDLLDLYELQEFYDGKASEHEDFEPTVSLLDLDYEFAVEVELDSQTDGNALRAIPTVKTGNFAVDFNIAPSLSQPASLSKTPDTPSAR